VYSLGVLAFLAFRYLAGVHPSPLVLAPTGARGVSLVAAENSERKMTIRDSLKPQTDTGDTAPPGPNTAPVVHLRILRPQCSSSAQPVPAVRWRPARWPQSPTLPPFLSFSPPTLFWHVRLACTAEDMATGPAGAWHFYWSSVYNSPLDPTLAQASTPCCIQPGPARRALQDDTKPRRPSRLPQPALQPGSQSSPWAATSRPIWLPRPLIVNHP
jgi:hypothetical protein